MGADVAGFAMLAATALQAGGAYSAGKSGYKAARGEAAQMDALALETQAAKQREAAEIDRQGRYKAGRMLAVAAASGGGAGDPTVQNLISAFGADVTYNKLVALYEGDSAAAKLRAEADAMREYGRQMRTAGKMSALSTALSGGASLYSRYYPKKDVDLLGAGKTTYGNYSLTLPDQQNGPDAFAAPKWLK